MTTKYCWVFGGDCLTPGQCQVGCQRKENSLVFNTRENIKTLVLVADTLDQRGKAYGPYIDNARMAQALKKAVRLGGFFEVMPADEQQSLDEMFTKVARIVTGSGSQRDSWLDIEGYARLVRERIEREAKDETGSGKS